MNNKMRIGIMKTNMNTNANMNANANRNGTEKKRN